MNSPAELTYRTHYEAEPEARAALALLLRDIFELDLGPMEAFTGWDPTSRSFSYFAADGTCVANVGVFAMPLLLRGRPAPAIGVQSVAVRPAWRGRGLFRDLMQRALLWCDGQAPLALLTTETPALYEGFGFRVVPEHCFAGTPPKPSGLPSARPLSLESETDRTLLLRLFRPRAAVSARFGLLNQAEMFPLMLREIAGAELHYLPALDCTVATAPGDAGTLRLLDIVGPSIPPLAAILGALGLRPSRIEVCFAPDRLAWEGEPRLLAGKIPLMARGGFLAADEPFALPPTAAF